MNQGTLFDFLYVDAVLPDSFEHALQLSPVCQHNRKVLWMLCLPARQPRTKLSRRGT